MHLFFFEECGKLNKHKHVCTYTNTHIHKHRLIIGVSVGIPIIILIIVAVVVAYCVCHYYHNRKMRTLVATYHRRRREEDRRRQTRYLAPPPYSTLGEDDDKDTELPSYTERDPYNTSLNDSSLDTAVVESASRGDGGSPNEQGLTPHSEAAPQETVASVELEESGETGSASTEQSTSDQAPLLDEGGEQ